MKKIRYKLNEIYVFCKIFFKVYIYNNSIFTIILMLSKTVYMRLTHLKFII